jgi:Mn-dependent DtxR family transcriptional regulator
MTAARVKAPDGGTSGENAVSDSESKEKAAHGHDGRNASGLTSSLEDYLTAVFVCSFNGRGQTRNMDIADFLGRNKTSVTKGMYTLARLGLVRMGADGYRKFLFLTPKGRALAGKLHGRRLAVAAFLESLGLSESAAAAEADLWEHGISYETADAMKKAPDCRTDGEKNGKEPGPP